MISGEPVWELARRFPVQGAWTEAEYLALPEGYPRVELSGGSLEVLPMPTDRHQAILTTMLLRIVALAQRIGGWARPAGLRVRVGAGRFREPDVAFLSRSRGALRGEEYWSGADLVVEVVSGSDEDRARDFVTKRNEYAQAGIPEYWIIDPRDERVLVLELANGEYVEHCFARGQVARSMRYAELEVSVDELLDAE
jgi:Uma2 family endonuclease